jgi:archaellin
MRRSVTLIALLTVFSVMMFAKSFEGRLIDATCYDQQKSAATCDPTSTTTAFALLVSNQAYSLDAEGNAKAGDALRSRADRSANPNAPTSTRVTAKISGTVGANNILKVDTVTIQ